MLPTAPVGSGAAPAPGNFRHTLSPSSKPCQPDRMRLFLIRLAGLSHLAVGIFAGDWQSLFDGHSRAGWQSTEFAGRGEVETQNGVLTLGQGALTGVNFTNPTPKQNYEVELEARRVLGNDFFMGLTFPVGDTFCTWINGGWGGAVVGLSSIDGADASENSTTQYRKFERDRWFRFRLQVTPDKISGWIDDQAVIEADIRGKKISLRSGEIEQSAPFGFAAWNTKAELKNIRLRSLNNAVTPVGTLAPSTPSAGCEALLKAAVADSPRIYARLAELCDRFGPRLVGSQNHEAAISWILEQMKQDGLEQVHGEPVSVPRWVRGPERCDLVRLGPALAAAEALPVLGLGGTIGTPPEGITASILVVTNFTELTNRAAEAKGRIVVFDAPFTEYGDTVRYRYSGAVSAAAVGAVGSLVRAVGPFGLRTPHTGMMSYEGAEQKIPHASLASEDTARLRRWQERGVTPVLHLQLDAHLEGEVASQNIIAELRGREHPEEIIVVGAHSDSWDVGQGAQDDGGGIVAAWEAVHLMKKLDLRPRRTVRVVLWTHEEAGGRGARAYRDQHRSELTNHVFAFESDSGTFAPKGFAFTGSDAGFAQLQPLGRLLGERLGAGEIRRGGAEADIAPLLAEGVPVGGPRTANEKYYWFHHTNADTVDKVDPQDLAHCTGLMAAVIYWIAEQPERLPR